jgi:hypothetical protein
MKRLVLLLLSLAVAAPLGATAQAPDILKIGGKTYSLHTNPLRPIAEEIRGRFPKPVVVSSGLWRGYIATFRVRTGRLYLDDVRVPTKKYMDSDAPQLEQFRSIMKELFDDPAPRIATWYTGNLIVPTGELVGYVHMGYASTYSSYLVVTVVKGVVREQREMNADDFGRFRRAQYAAWKKTPAYAKELAEAKSGANPLTDEMAEDFIFQFASEEYLSRIVD